MSDRRLAPIGAEISADPIGAIARAERQRLSDNPASTQAFDAGPDLVEPSRLLAPQGMAGAVDRALGSVKLPTLLELANALDDISGHVDALAEIDPGMAEVASAVLGDEQRKVMRYLDLRDN